MAKYLLDDDGKFLFKRSNLDFALKLNARGEADWNTRQRPLIENVIRFFNDRQMVNEGVKIHIDWDNTNTRWYYIYFENIDDATLFELTFAEYF
jgi:hypothetical protein